MFNWLNFFNIIFWVLFLFFFNSYNFFFLIFLSELVWILLYVYSGLIGSVIDDSFISSFTFFILGFASIELSIGLMLVTFLRYLNISLNALESSSSSLNLFFKNFFNLKKKNSF